VGARDFVGIEVISHPHIPLQTLFLPDILVRANVKVTAKKVATSWAWVTMPDLRQLV
jgi:hypothetical protein